MNVDDVHKLKFDRRLQGRRDWLKPGEIESHLEGLPDAADKIQEPSEDEVDEAAPAADPGEAPVPGV